MQESLKSIKLELIVLAAFAGIFVYHNFISPSVKQDQKSDKSEMRENPSKDFGKLFEIILFSFVLQQIHTMNGFKRFLTLINISFLIKTKTDEDEDPNNYLPPATKYDPRINYEKLVWNEYYEKHKGEEFAEETKKLFDSLNREQLSFLINRTHVYNIVVFNGTVHSDFN